MGDIQVNNVRRLIWLLLAIGVGGCERFVLSDESAMQRLMSTHYVSELRAKSETKLICFVEEAKPGDRRLYLGEDHPDHTVRLRTFRVDDKGRVWVNADLTLLEDRWVEVR